MKSCNSTRSLRYHISKHVGHRYLIERVFAVRRLETYYMYRHTLVRAKSTTRSLLVFMADTSL